MEKPAALEELIEALRCLPGVGPKSAQRMAYHLLQRDQQGAERLSRGLADALARIRHCARCNTFTEAETLRAVLFAAARCVAAVRGRDRPAIC